MDPNSEQMRNEDEGSVKPPEGGDEMMPSSDPSFGEQIETGEDSSMNEQGGDDFGEQLTEMGDDAENKTHEWKGQSEQKLDDLTD